MVTTTLVANRINAALSHRTWAIDGSARCHLFLLLAGQASFSSPGKPGVEITAPAVLWLPQSVRGAVRIIAGGEGYTASIGQEFVQRAMGNPGLTVHLRPLLDSVLLAGPDMIAPQLGIFKGSFTALVEESLALRQAAGAMAGLHLATLLLLLWRCIGTVRQAGQRGATTVQRFRQLVELHYREGLHIDEFAARLGVTRWHLHDACLRATSQTPLALLHDRLLAEARDRLEQTDLSVEQVGYGIGFRDPGYFNRFFKRLSGQTPGAYRRSVVAARPPGTVPSFAAWP